ncbi:MAG: hypothetical protein V1836_00545 [Candidatus Aenigmatarchaeota archaeon]
MKIKNRNLGFLLSKYLVFLELLSCGWAPQDLFFDGGPDFIALKGDRLLRFKVRYSTKNNKGFLFAAGGEQAKTFYELAEGCDYLVFVCLLGSEAAGFYVFPRDSTPKAKTFFHPADGPYPKYREFYGLAAFKGSSGKQGVG